MYAAFIAEYGAYRSSIQAYTQRMSSCLCDRQTMLIIITVGTLFSYKLAGKERHIAQIFVLSIFSKKEFCCGVFQKSSPWQPCLRESRGFSRQRSQHAEMWGLEHLSNHFFVHWWAVFTKIPDHNGIQIRHGDLETVSQKIYEIESHLNPKPYHTAGVFKNK